MITVRAYTIWSSERAYQTRSRLAAEAMAAWLGLRSWARLRPERITITTMEATFEAAVRPTDTKSGEPER